MPSKAAPVKAAEETKEDTSVNMSDTNTSETTAVTSPVPKAAKRDNEGNPKEPEVPTETAKASAGGGPKPSPTSEVKKQNAAVSLTQLFTTTQDSLTSCESGTNDTLGEAGNFLAECFSGEGEGEHGHLAVDTNAAAVHAEGESSTPTMENTTAVVDGQPSKKKSKGVDGHAMPALPPIKTEGDEELATTTAEGKKQETPLALKAGAYRLNKLMEATKFTSPIPEHPPAVQADAAEGEEMEVQEEPPQKVPVNRKEKSLALVCQNFMELCRDAPPCGENDEAGALVELNELAQHLGVKRRRIYDIINIMESVRIVSRLKKNTYRWHGTEKLPLYFARLQRDGLAELRAGVNQDKNQVKGMTLTAQKLIQYFLTTGLMEIRLNDAAEAVLGPSEEKTFKTKIRRMYDIANVLTALGIVRKENIAGSTTKAQPSFKWVYPILPQDMAAHLPPDEQTGPVELIPPQPPAISSMPSLDQEVEGSFEVREEEASQEVAAPEEEAEQDQDVDVKQEESVSELVSV